MGFEITTKAHFAAAHRLRLGDGSWESLHGHNWTAKITVSAARLDAIGLVMDFHELTRLVEGIILPMRNVNLNDLPQFERENPSAENVALHIGRSLRLPEGITLEAVEVWETPENSAVFRP